MSEYIPILEECLSIAKERGKTYGSAIENCNDASKIMKEAFNDDITPEQCCKVIIATKLARSRFKYKKDNYLDIINYFAILISLHDNNSKLRKSIRNAEVERDKLHEESFGERVTRKVEEQKRKDARGGEKSWDIFDTFFWGTNK